MSDDFHTRCDRLESELDSLLSPAELQRIRGSETRRAEAHDLAPVELPNLRAPRLPTFFADPITGVATDLPVELDTVPDNEPSDGDSAYPEPDDSSLARYTYDPVTGGVFDEFGRVR